MNKLAPMLAVLLCATAFRAPAQISAAVTIEQQQFLPGEAIPVAVKITNRSGRTLHIGDEPDWLTFSIEGHEGERQPRSEEHTSELQSRFGISYAVFCLKK